MNCEDAIKLAITTLSQNLENKQKLNPNSLEIINIVENEKDCRVPLEKYSKHL